MLRRFSRFVQFGRRAVNTKNISTCVTTILSSRHRNYLVSRLSRQISLMVGDAGNMNGFKGYVIESTEDALRSIQYLLAHLHSFDEKNRERLIKNMVNYFNGIARVQRNKTEDESQSQPNFTSLGGTSNVVKYYVQCHLSMSPTNAEVLRQLGNLLVSIENSCKSEKDKEAFIEAITSNDQFISAILSQLSNNQQMSNFNQAVSLCEQLTLIIHENTVDRFSDVKMLSTMFGLLHTHSCHVFNYPHDEPDVNDLFIPLDSFLSIYNERKANNTIDSSIATDSKNLSCISDTTNKNSVKVQHELEHQAIMLIHGTKLWFEHNHEAWVSAMRLIERLCVEDSVVQHEVKIQNAFDLFVPVLENSGNTTNYNHLPRILHVINTYCKTPSNRRLLSEIDGLIEQVLDKYMFSEEQRKHDGEFLFYFRYVSSIAGETVSLLCRDNESNRATAMRLLGAEKFQSLMDMLDS